MNINMDRHWATGGPLTNRKIDYAGHSQNPFEYFGNTLYDYYYYSDVD